MPPTPVLWSGFAAVIVLCFVYVSAFVCLCVCVLCMCFVCLLPAVCLFVIL